MWDFTEGWTEAQIKASCCSLDTVCRMDSPMA